MSLIGVMRKGVGLRVVQYGVTRKLVMAMSGTIWGHVEGCGAKGGTIWGRMKGGDGQKWHDMGS